MRELFLATLLALCSTLPVRALAADQHHHEAAPQLSLDHGRKWAADGHTIAAVGTMKSTVAKAAKTSAKASVDALHATGKQLEGQLQELIRGCTMQGPAHEQLHAWISSLAPEIQALIQSANAQAARAALEKVSARLGAFGEHFEAGL